MSSGSSHAHAAAGRLCLDCGLCCNGVLFDRVELQREDQARVLTALGLKIKKRSFFVQPCVALCGVLCTIYDNRPTRCRRFACRQYQQVAAGKLPEDTARARIREVKDQVQRIEKLLSLSDSDNPGKSITQRCATAMARADALGSEAPPELAALPQAAQALEAALSEHFRVT